MRHARHIGLHIYPSFYARQIGQKKHRVFVKLRKNLYCPAVFKAHRQDYWQIPEHYHQVINSACVNPTLSVQLVHVNALNPLYRAGGETFWGDDAHAQKSSATATAIKKLRPFRPICSLFIPAL